MLFDKDFDESLWCILEGDSDQRIGGISVVFAKDTVA